MNRKVILFFILGWLVAAFIGPRDVLSRLRGAA